MRMASSQPASWRATSAASRAAQLGDLTDAALTQSRLKDHASDGYYWPLVIDKSTVKWRFTTADARIRLRHLDPQF
jgi:hypothetical protein